MIDAPVLDTHAWIWWLDRDRRLGPKVIDALDRLPADARPWLSDISLWEVATLVERGRLAFSLPFDEWLEAAAHPRTVRLVSITPSVASAITTLPSSFHRDPADRVIVATCRTLNAPLLTKDRLILSSKLVKRWTAS